jgi:hypothetical protein
MKEQRERNYALIRVSLSGKKRLDQLCQFRHESMPRIVDNLLEGDEGGLQLSDRNMRYLERTAKQNGKTVSQVLERIIIEYRGQKMADELAAHYEGQRQLADPSELDDIKAVSLTSSLGNYDNSP